MKKFFYIFFLVTLTFTISCSGRVPSPKTAQSVAKKYFHSYGKKYANTYFGAKNVSNVVINAVEEVSHKTAMVDSIVHLVDGHVARTLLKMERKFPKGWHVVSWEMLQYR